MQAWQQASGDPDDEVCKWLLHGTPVGIKQEIKLVGICPPYTNGPDLQHESLVTDFSSFENYSGVESDDTAMHETKHQLNNNRLKSFDTLSDLREELKGEEPVLNKIGIITRIREGVTKKRMILDTSARDV